MPLRDHFHPPMSSERGWDGFHAGWPMMMVSRLVQLLPEYYIAEPGVHIGSFLEIDLGAFNIGDSSHPRSFLDRGNGGTTTALWAPPQPTLAIETELPNADEYEVRIYDTRPGRRLVAAVEIVSPSNKDRPEHRREFVAKCASLLREGIFVAIVDIVTIRTANLYEELLDHFGQTDPSLKINSFQQIAAACRWTRKKDGSRLEAWTYPLAIGQPLPTLPLWLDENLAVPLELEASYEETCRILRIR